MGKDKQAILNELGVVINQAREIVDLYERGLITPDVYRAWLDGQWAVIHYLHGLIRD